MNIEEFESQFRNADPANELPALNDAERAALLDSAVHGEPANVIPLAPRQRSRYLAVAAAAALVVGGVSLSGLQHPGTQAARLEFAGGSNTGATTADAQLSQTDGRYAGAAVKTSAIAMYAGFYVNYVFDASLAGDAYSSNGYEMVNLPNVEARIKAMATSLGVTISQVDQPIVVASEGQAQDSTTATDPSTVTQWSTAAPKSTDAPGKSFNATIDAHSNYVGYYDPAGDPFNQCIAVKSNATDGGPSCTVKAPEHLGSKAEAIAAAKDALQGWGFNTSDFRFESTDQAWAQFDNEAPSIWARTVTATLVVDGMDTPISWYFSYGDNMILTNVSGQFSDMKSLGSFRSLSAFDALDRLNKLNATNYDRAAKELKKQQLADEAAQSSASGSSGASGAPVTVGSSNNYGMAPRADFTVTRVVRTMGLAGTKDGRQVWLPAYQVFGKYADSSDEFQSADVVNVVDDQIDFASLYSYSGVMALATDAVAR